MADRTESLGVLFADISDSTSLFKKYGDERGRDILLECLKTIGDVASTCGGTVLERIGDELLCTFSTAELAAKASIEMQKAVERARCAALIPSETEIRVGFHFGPVLREGQKLFGDTVYNAKRVSALAKGQQIITTLETVKTLGPEWKPGVRFVDRTSIKGKQEVFEVYEIIWNEDLLTVDEPDLFEDESPVSEMCLEFDGEAFLMDASHPFFTIGRSDHCSFVVKDKDVSRLHARIEYRKGKFILTDVSRNGTAIVNDRGSVSHVHRDEFPLTGCGSVCVGAKGHAQDRRVLRYCCRQGCRQGTGSREP